MHTANRSRLSCSMLLGTAAGLLALATAPPPVALAVDTGIAASKLTLDLGARPRVTFSAKDPGVALPVVEPALRRFGATVEIALGNQAAAFVVGDGLRRTITSMPIGRWSVSPRAARFRKLHASQGASQVRSLVISSGRNLTMVANGAGDVPFQVGSGNPSGGVFVAVTVQSSTTERMCTRFTACTPDTGLSGVPERLTCVGGVPDPDCRAAATTCHDADGQCPANCTPMTDDDCTPCGYGPDFVGLCDGTTVDLTNGRQWETKSVSDGVPNPADLHDVDNRYAWAGRCGLMARSCQPNADAAATCIAATGDSEGCGRCVPIDFCIVDAHGDGTITTIWDWLNQVNDEKLGGFSDWRVPTYPAELAAIRPRINQFGGAAIGSYWTGSRLAAPAGSADAVPFDGRPDIYVTADKSTGLFVRAVRNEF